jgi:hypothetical protein
VAHSDRQLSHNPKKNEGFSGCKNQYQMKSCEAAGNPSGNQFQVNSLSSAFLVTERETLR